MRTISAADDALFTAVGGRATFLRVDTQDGGSTYRDMTTYLGQNFVLSAQWGDSNDGESQNGQVVFKREVEQLSTAPLMTQSPANVGLVFGGSYSPLVYIGRGIRIYTADIPDGQSPGASDWRLMFDGQIEKVNEAQGETVTVDVCDKIQAGLRDAFIEVERVYAFATGANALKGCRTWTALTSIAQNELMLPTDANKNGHFFKDTTAGSNSTGGNEPIWPTGAGSTVVDSGVTWTEVGATASMAIWSAGLAVATGDRIAPTALNANGHFYIAQGPGQTGGSEPSWPTGAGSTVNDNGIVWKESGAIATAVETIMAQIAADNGQSVTVNLPGGSPNWLIKMFIQQRQGLWDALRTLVDQIGWDLRPQWDSGSNTFKLNLWLPNRSKSTPDRTFGPADKYDVQSLEIDISKVRNAVEVIFSASGSLDPSGNPLRVAIIVSDSTSIAKYGRRYMLLGEASTSTVDTSTEATAMANACLSDLKEPNAEKQVLIPYFPFTELGDLYRFSNDAVYSDTNLDLAVVGYQHSVDSDGKGNTQLTCRGKPSTGCDRWLSKDARGNSDDVHATTLADADQPKFTAKDVVGGTLLTLAASGNKRNHGQDYEWHVGAPGFTPSQSTVVQSQGGNQITVPHLVPGKGYEAKIVPVRRNASRPVRGQALTTGFAFTAARAQPGHLYSDPDITTLPLNGGFEGNSEGSAGPPDHFIVSVGTWNTDFETVIGSGGLSGQSYLSCKDTIAGQIVVSDAFMVRQGGLYRLDLLVRDHLVGHAQATVDVQWLDSTKTPTGSPFSMVSGGVTAWALGTAAGVAPSNARWARIRIYQTNPVDAHGFDVDRIQVREVMPTGFLVFGNGTLPAASVTNYLQPSFVQNASDATERKIAIPNAYNAGVLVAGSRYMARVAQTNVTYVFTVRVNGVDSVITWTVNSGATTGGDGNAHFIFLNDADQLSVKVVATAAGGPVAASDAVVTLPIYSW